MEGWLSSMIEAAQVSAEEFVDFDEEIPQERGEYKFNEVICPVLLEQVKGKLGWCREQQNWTIVEVRDQGCIYKLEDELYKILFITQNVEPGNLLKKLVDFQGINEFSQQLSGRRVMSVDVNNEIQYLRFDPGIPFSKRGCVLWLHKYMIGYDHALIGTNVQLKLNYHLPKFQEIQFEMFSLVVVQLQGIVQLEGYFKVDMGANKFFESWLIIEFLRNLIVCNDHIQHKRVFKYLKFSQIHENANTEHIENEQQAHDQNLPLNRLATLTQSQKQTFNTFKKMQPAYDDNCLCRFLIARNWNLDAANSLLIETMQWRERVRPQDIQYVDVVEIAEKGIITQFSCDKAGRPVIYIRSRRYFPKQLNLHDMDKFVLWLIETSINEMPPHVDTFTVIADMKNISMSNFSLSHIKHFAPIIQDYYPERLAKAFVINISWTVKTLWNTVKLFLDENTLSKICFLEGDEMGTLLEHFDPEHLPIEYGGKAYMPQPLLTFLKIMANKGECVKVVVRCRPMNDKEINDGRLSIVSVDENMASISVHNPKQSSESAKTFTYDATYGQESIQDNIYLNTGYPIVESVLEGYNGTIFAYGQTGTGKTFTMEGVENPHEMRGILPRTFEQIFYGVEQHPHAQFLIRASFLDIYKEEIHDLLAKNLDRKLELKENVDSGFYVKDLSSFVVKNIEEMREIMRTGQKNRHTGETQMNKSSSRSHSIFQIAIERSEVENDGIQHYRMGKLNLVDLAGSERQSKTGASGERLKEATNINKSLLTLGNVISALVDGQSSHVPYRDSKLTRLLADSLGGNTKTVMIANIGPADWNYDETISTLRYANRAKNIKNRPQINEDPKDLLLRQLQEEIALLRQQLDGSGMGGGQMVQNPLTGQMVPMSQVVEVEKPVYVEDKERMRLLEEEIERKKHDIKARAERQIQKIREQKDLAEDEKSKLIDALQRKERQKRKAKDKQQRMLRKLKAMEEKLVMGSQIMEEAQRQELELQVARQEMEAQKQQKMLLERQLREKKEKGEVLEQRYTTYQEQIKEINKKLKKLWMRYQGAQTEAIDLKQEFQREREDLMDTIRVLTQQLKLKSLIIEHFVPREETSRLERRAQWDDEEDEWILPPLDPTKVNEKSRRPQSAVGLKAPTSEYSRIARALGDGNTRFKDQDILSLDLDLPERTTEDYEGEVNPQLQQLVSNILNDVVDDIIFMPIESFQTNKPQKARAGKRPSSRRNRPPSAARQQQ